MNKLVSRNPIQRFKLGNRIVKFQQAGKVYASRPREVHGAEVNGERVGYVEIPGKGYVAISPSGKAYNYNGNGAVGQLNFKPINLSNYDLYHIQRAAQTPGKITGFTSRDASAVANYWVNKKPSYQRTSSKIVVNKQEKTPTIQEVSKEVINVSPKGLTSKTGSTTSSVKKISVTKPAVVANRAVTGYTLPEGVTSVADTQTMLKNAGFDLGKYGVDGVWGKDTQAAYDAWKNSLNSKVNPTAASEVNKEFINIPLTASITSPATIIPNTITAPQITYDRTGIRQLIRDKGFNPYQFSGAQRRALRIVMNGQGTDTDRAIVSGMGIFKKGGLISKNPIKRFKNGGIQKFQKSGNLPIAPKAEDRYRGGQRVNVETKGGRYGGNDRVEIKEVQGKKPGMFGSVPFIRQTVVHSSVSPDYNDTTYIEVPERKNFLVQRKLRGVEKHPSVFRTYYSKVYPFYGSILPDLGSGSKQEYETLKQRFNTAWNIAK